MVGEQVGLIGRLIIEFAGRLLRGRVVYGVVSVFKGGGARIIIMMAAEGGLRHVLVGGHQKVVLLGCQLLVGAGECLLTGLAVGGGLVHPACQLTDEFVLVYISGGGTSDEDIVEPVEVLYLVYEALVLHLLLK